MNRKLTGACALFLLVSTKLASACTAFGLPGENGSAWMAKSLDWDENHGMLLTNPRHLEKTAFVKNSESVPARWQSRYGSLTFNQIAREWPYGGLNEAGLAMELLWLPDTQYARPDSREALGELQWVQYVLDNYASVGELKSGLAHMRISPFYAPIHAFTCDASGACAVVEFLNGEATVHGSPEWTVPTLANHTYEKSVDFLRLHQGFGGFKPIPKSMGSLDRFVRAAHFVREFEKGSLPEKSPADAAFKILGSVWDKASTQWNMVYDLGGRRVSYRLDRNADPQTVALSAFDFSCRHAPQVRDVRAGGSGDVSAGFRDYAAADHEALVARAARKYAAQAPDVDFERLKTYPATLRCVE